VNIKRVSGEVGLKGGGDQRVCGGSGMTFEGSFLGRGQKGFEEDILTVGGLVKTSGGVGASGLKNRS